MTDRTCYKDEAFVTNIILEAMPEILKAKKDLTATIKEDFCGGGGSFDGDVVQHDSSVTAAQRYVEWLECDKQYKALCHLASLRDASRKLLTEQEQQIFTLYFCQSHGKKTFRDMVKIIGLSSTSQLFAILASITRKMCETVIAVYPDFCYWRQKNTL